jgi:hypothetical protein
MLWARLLLCVGFVAMTRPDDNMLPVYAELAQVSSFVLLNLCDWILACCCAT